MLPETRFFDDEIDTGPAPPEFPRDDPAYTSFDRYAECLLRKRELARELDGLEKELKHLAPYLLRYWEANPFFPRASVRGLTIYKQNDRWARPREGCSRQEVCQALRAAGGEWADFIHDEFSTSGLTKHIKELEEDHISQTGDDLLSDVYVLLPPQVAEVLNMEPIPKVMGRSQKRVRKSK